LYIGCESCNGERCEFCTIHLDFESCKKVQNLLIRWNENRSPFFSFASWYLSATEIGILSPSSGDLKAGTSLTQLKESSEVFSWQQGKGLMEIYSEDAKSPGWSFPAKKITCVELAITPRHRRTMDFSRTDSGTCLWISQHLRHIHRVPAERLLSGNETKQRKAREAKLESTEIEVRRGGRKRLCASDVDTYGIAKVRAYAAGMEIQRASMRLMSGGNTECENKEAELRVACEG
jgi:hypothetical protein